MNRRERDILMGAENFDPNDRVECLLAVFSASGRQAICDTFLKCAHTNDTAIYAINNGIQFEQIPNPTIEATLECFQLSPYPVKFYSDLPESFRGNEQVQRAIILSLRSDLDIRHFFKSFFQKTDQLIFDTLLKYRSNLIEFNEIIPFLRDDVVRSLFISLTSTNPKRMIMPEMTLYDALRLTKSVDSISKKFVNKCTVVEDKFFRIYVMFFEFPRISRDSAFFVPRTMLEHLIIFKNCSFHSRLDDYGNADLREKLEEIWNTDDIRATFESLPRHFKQSEDVQTAIILKKRHNLDDWFTLFKETGMSDHVLILFTRIDTTNLSEWESPSSMRQLCLAHSTVDSLAYTPNLTTSDVIVSFMADRFLASRFVRFFEHCPANLLRDENLRNFLIGQMKRGDVADVLPHLEAIRPFSRFEKFFIKSL